MAYNTNKMEPNNKSIKRLFDIPYFQLNTYNLATSIMTKYDGQWKSISTKKYIEQSNKISRALIQLGVTTNDKIAIISTTNRTEWNICDIGILQTGAANVPIYPTITKEDYEYILNHSEATYCFVSDAVVLEKLNQIKANTKLKAVFTFDEIDNEKNWKELLELGDDSSNQAELEKRKNDITTDDIATLIYTSGTTGKPKGVLLSHKNLVSNVLAVYNRMPLTVGQDKALSFLPLCHIFERMMIYLYQYSGISIYYAESIEKITDNLMEIRPQAMTAVPRLYEKIYDKIITKGTALSGLKKGIFFWAIDLGLKYEPYNGNSWWYRKKLVLAKKLIFSKWQQALGGNIKIMVSGGAALQPRLLRIFLAADLPIMEGYGLTETSPVIAVNDLRNKGLKIGTPGKPIDGVTLKIAEDGEILIKGANVMKGYYKDEAKTTEVISNAYFHTGDIGEIDAEGFLKITGRKKEMFKTSGGKYVVPTLLENQLKQSRFIEQAMVVGEGEKMPAAIIQPNFEFLKLWAKEKNIPFQSNKDLINDPRVVNRINEEVTLCNAKFGKWEQIKKIQLTPDEWSVDGGQLTPKMSIKRKVIKEIYLDLYKKLYSSDF